MRSGEDQAAGDDADRIMSAARLLSVGGDDGSRDTPVNASDEARRPKAMRGIETRRMRRRPMRSMAVKAMPVKTKFVQAMRSAVPVGDRNLARAKMEALKYMSVFCNFAI
jgi:hypothetical protein